MTGIKSSMSSNSGLVRQLSLEFRARERGINVVDMIVPSCLIGSSSKLQVTRTGIKSRTRSISAQIGLFVSD